MMRAKTVGCCYAALLVSTLSATASADYKDIMEDQNSTGYSWNGHGDWAYGYYKGECAKQNTGGNGMFGVSGDLPYPAKMKVHGLECRYNNGSYYPIFASSYWNSSYNIEWWDNSSGQEWTDWDPGYPKATCHGNSQYWPEMVAGIAQSGNLTTIIRCAQIDRSMGQIVDYQHCYARRFGVNNDGTIAGNDPSVQLPDWDPGYYKGLCDIQGPNGVGVTGVSYSLAGGQFRYTVHGILCCPLTHY